MAGGHISCLKLVISFRFFLLSIVARSFSLLSWVGVKGDMAHGLAEHDAVKIGACLQE